MTYTSSYSLGTARSRFAANTYTTGNQTFADLAPLATGGFVVGYGTVLDFLGPNFAPTHHYVVAEGSIESIAAFDNGNVAALVGDGTDDHIQIFDSTGHQFGATIDIGETGGDVSILALHNNNLVITYSYAPAGENARIYMDEYDPTGHLINTRQVDSDPATDFYRYGSAKSLTDGGFVITYDRYIGDYQHDIWGTVFNANGSVRTADHAFVGVGSEDEYVNAVTVGLDDGGFAMAYRYIDPDPSGFLNEPEDVVLRTYNASGVEIGSARVLAHDDGSDYGTFGQIQISKLENGFIAVSWQRNLDDAAGADQYLTILDETASPAGLPTNVVLAHYPDGSPDRFIDVSALLSGNLAFAGTDSTVDGSGTGVAVTVKELTRTSIGTGGADPFLGDALSDKVYAGGGADLVTTVGGRDTVYGEAGEDFINGGAGGDYLYGGTENDVVIGDAGDDYVSGDEGNDTVSGDAGNDIVLGGSENDSVGGGDGDDTLYGEAGTDTLAGGAGNDRLDGGTGADTLTGGLGNDIYVLAEIHALSRSHYGYDSVIEDRGAFTGKDTVVVTALASKFAPSGYVLPDNVEYGTVTGTADFTLTGNRLANVLHGNDAANTLNGGAGFDQLVGGKGNDIYVLNDTSDPDNNGGAFYDVVSEGLDGGTDTVRVRGLVNHGYKLPDNVENGTITGNGQLFQLEGNDLANRLVGGDGGDRFIGNAGNDRLTGGDGSDVFLYQNVNAAGWGKDVITDFVHGSDLITFYHVAEITKFRDLTITDHKGNALITTPYGDTIELLGVAASAVRPGDFSFVPLMAAPTGHPGAIDHFSHAMFGGEMGTQFQPIDITALV